MPLKGVFGLWSGSLGLSEACFWFKHLEQGASQLDVQLHQSNSLDMKFGRVCVEVAFDEASGETQVKTSLKYFKIPISLICFALIYQGFVYILFQQSFFFNQLIHLPHYRHTFLYISL